MQPGRACYIERAADDALLASIADQQFTYILSPRASGKSSLMAHAIRRLRQEGQLAAVVDLTQIGARGDNEDAGRWYYSIAYRIVRELRLKVDLQTWWQDKSALFSEQRLVEFFWEIILANTTEPVTIFFDEIERALELPFSDDMFSALRTCYARRVSEPDFTRLNFVVLGVASPSQLCSDPGLSPFVDGREVRLDDFTLEESYRLTPGVSMDETVGHDVLKRVFHWAHGHPYLTQKIARAVARKGGRSAEVERVVQAQFMAGGASQEEPLLNHIRSVLEQKAAARPALALLSKIAKGSTVPAERGTAAAESLRLAGVVRATEDGHLTYRNRIYEQVFDRRWASAVLPINWRKPLAIAAAAVAVVLLPLWYTQVLPRPYIATLSVVTQDIAVAEDAYQRLRRLPGFAATADRLLAEAMIRRSEQAQSLDDVLAADAVLRNLPERSELADAALGRYWLGRARQAMAAEQRDRALLLAMQALPGRPEDAQALVAELVGSDYPRLRRSYRSPEPPTNWAVDWRGGRLVSIDQVHRLRSQSLTAAAVARPAVGPNPLADTRLTALQHVPVVREIEVAADGLAGAFDLRLDLEHARASDLLVSLRAPNGEVAILTLPDTAGGPQATRLLAGQGSPLASLMSGPRRGVWRLSIVDRRAASTGVLSSWQLQFGAADPLWRDEPEQGVALPDPVRTDEVAIDLSDDGTVALVRPARDGAQGALAVWDLVDGRLRADLPLDAPPDEVLFSANAARAVVVTGAVMTIWDLDNEIPAARLATETEFVLPPTMSMDGQFLAVAERTDFPAPLFSLLQLEDGTVMAGVAGVAATREWVLGPDARYLALLGANGQVTLADPHTGRQYGELRHHQEIRRVIPVPNGKQLLTVDSVGDIHVWTLGADEPRALPEPQRLGATLDAGSVHVAAAADSFAYVAPDGHATVRFLNEPRAARQFRLDAATADTRTRLAPDGLRLLTVNDGLMRLWDVDAPPLAADAGDGDVSALAVDGNGSIVAVGYGGGHVRVRNADQLRQSAAQSFNVDFIGHRGAVSSLAVNAARNLLASGGADGVVRVWDLVSVSPSEYFLRHPLGPVRAVAISPDGRWVASAAEYSARVWQVRDGALVGEVPVNGAATAVAFASGGELLAVGDSAGNVFFGAPRGSDPWRSLRMPAAVRAAAFSPDSRWLATGDASGRVQLWDTGLSLPAGDAAVFQHPIYWLAFSSDGAHVVARSGHWVHRLSFDESGLSVSESRLVEPGFDSAAVLLAPDASSLRIVGGFEAGPPTTIDVGLLEPAAGTAAPDSSVLARDWPAVLGLQLDMDTGLVREAL